MIAAVTGPRLGTTPDALITAAQFFRTGDIEVLHDGDALGVDSQIYHIAKAFGVHVILHPPKNPKWRAFLGDNSDEILEEKAYGARDRDMILSSEVLLTLPDCYEPKPHSGTWLTIGFAREVQMPIVFIWNNGQYKIEQEDTLNELLHESRTRVRRNIY
jgi:hypothetical protein